MDGGNGLCRHHAIGENMVDFGYQRDTSMLQTFHCPQMPGWPVGVKRGAENIGYELAERLFVAGLRQGHMVNMVLAIERGIEYPHRVVQVKGNPDHPQRDAANAEARHAANNKLGDFATARGDGRIHRLVDHHLQGDEGGGMGLVIDKLGISAAQSVHGVLASVLSCLTP